MGEYIQTSLYGGAITALLPVNFGDVSAIRQVPDNQEVYLDKTGLTSIVFDILERVDKPGGDDEALQVHVQDVIEDDIRDSKTWRTGKIEMRKLPPGTPSLWLFATSPPGEKQRGRPNAPDFVGVVLTLIRLEKHKTDVIVSINVPHVPGGEAANYSPNGIDLESGKFGPLMDKAMGYQAKIVESLEIKDWDLFVQE